MDKRKPQTPKEIAQRSRSARKGGLKRKKNLGVESGIKVDPASEKRSLILPYYDRKTG